VVKARENKFTCVCDEYAPKIDDLY
jgi:hypothetical protein